mmetsp:Transcript_94149/g.224104  ORF Transcript_94149/g.224104 Transcript_94149/m.224104 type:complete len:278 (+) Transcript_94149:497-1330(+)
MHSPGADIRKQPAAFLSNLHSRTGHKSGQSRERLTSEHGIRLGVAAGHDVAHSAERWRLHLGRVVAEELHDPLTDACIQNCLDVSLCTVGDVGDRPKGICQNFLVCVVQHPSHDRQCRKHRLEAGLRCAAAEVGDGPSRVPDAAGLGGALQDLEHFGQRASGNAQVSVLHRVTCDVPQSPNTLLENIAVRAVSQEVGNDRDGVEIDDCLRLVNISRDNVQDGPQRLKLQLRRIHLLTELEEAWCDAESEYLVNRRIPLHTENFPKVSGGVNLILHRG